MVSIPDNIRRFRDDLERECARLGRQSNNITVVAVSKTMTVEAIRAAHESGLTNFGENRIQEAKEKLPLVGITPAPTWHLVGHLQSNKAKYVVRAFDLIHSVDSLKLAREIDRRAEASGRVQPVLVQVNISGETTKGGTGADEAEALVQAVAGLAHLKLEGLMTMPPFFDAPDEATFQKIMFEPSSFSTSFTKS